MFIGNINITEGGVPDKPQLWKSFLNGDMSAWERDILGSILFKSVAVLLIAILAGLAVYTYQQPAPKGQKAAVHTIKTNYREKKTINFSDGSAMILGAKSRLSYKANWLQQTVKRVGLEGQAFFAIEPQETRNHPKFVVKTSDGSASVWGTRFVVNTYGPGTRVVLEKGEVRISAKECENEVTV